MISRVERNKALERWTRDPPPTTAFEVIDESESLRLRQYPQIFTRPGSPPLLLVYPMIKRPYVLDLLPERSVVRQFLRAGFSVYLTDWLPPSQDDAARGFDEYINQDLAHAVDVICEREGVPQVSLIGCCCGGLLAAIFSAMHPERVAHLVTFAAPFEVKPPVSALTVAQVVLAYGNVPAWMVASVLNARVQDAYQTALQLAHDLGEPELAEDFFSSPSPLLRAIGPWLKSDVPVAGKLVRQFLCEALPGAGFLEGRMRIGHRAVKASAIDCPVLVIAGERDPLVPPEGTLRFAQVVGSPDSSEFIFPAGHLGLMLSRTAHEELWPEVTSWLADRAHAPLQESA